MNCLVSHTAPATSVFYKADGNHFLTLFTDEGRDIKDKIPPPPFYEKHYANNKLLYLLKVKVRTFAK